MKVFKIISFYLMLTLIVTFGSIHLDRYGRKFNEETRNEVFHESAAYNDGMLRELSSLQLRYTQASDAEKAALKSVILHKFSVYDINRLPPDLQLFYRQLRGY